ncbi:MAG: hypothetical protein WCA57_00240 [Ilumatobacteraceae bacterium]
MDSSATAQPDLPIEPPSGRSSTRTRVGLAIGAAAVLVVGAVVLVVLGGSDEPDTIATAEVTIADTVDGGSEPTTLEVTSTEIPGAETPSADATGTQVTVLDRSAIPGVTAGEGGSPEFAEWVVPWGDGFLAGSTVLQSQPLPGELPEDVTALFPQEVIDLFDGELPPTIEEATRMLSEAGLLEEVSAVLRDNPEASDAIYGVPVTAPPDIEARFTTDGSEWEPIDLTLPADAGYLTNVATVDDRLVVAFQPRSADGFSNETGSFTVASTPDLATWTTQEVTVPGPDVELPTGISRIVNTQGLVANANGWALTVFESVNPDPLTLVREAGLSRPELSTDGGYGSSFDGTGIDVQVDDGSGQSTTRYTWEELGVGPEIVALLDEGGYTSTVWSSTWDGQAAPSETSIRFGELLATSAGFVQWGDGIGFSPDGRVWTERALPDPDAYVSGAFTFDDGVIVLATGADGTLDLYRLDATGDGAEPLAVSGLPAAGNGGFSGPGSSGSAIVIDAGVQAVPMEPLIVEVDGYRLTIRQPSGVFELSDAATGEVIVTENLARFGPGDESSFEFGIDGVTVSDPETGDVIVVIPTEVLNAAEEERYGGFEGAEYSPDLWLLASVDGERFVVDDLDDDGGLEGPLVAVANDERALVQIGNRWISYDLS